MSDELALGCDAVVDKDSAVLGLSMAMENGCYSIANRSNTCEAERYISAVNDCLLRQFLWTTLPSNQRSNE